MGHSRDEVKRVQWMFEEDTNRVAGHRGADIADVDGQFVPFSSRLSILIESHHLIYKDERGKAQAIVTIEADRKIRIRGYSTRSTSIDTFRGTS